MGKGKIMTGIERWRMLKLHRQNVSQSVIASEIGRSKTVTTNYSEDADVYAELGRNGAFSLYLKLKVKLAV